MERKYEITEEAVVVKNVFDKEDEAAFEGILRKAIGVDASTELDANLKETPKRYLKLLTEMTEGYRIDPSKYLEKSFPVNSPNLADDEEAFNRLETESKYEQGMVAVSCNAWSNCCHHIAPMRCRVDVVYIPGEKVVGLSKIIRCVKGFGKRLNLQEAWGENIANAMMRVLKPMGVMVRISGVHSCVSMRGAAEDSAKTTTTTVRGVFTDIAVRKEALNLMDRNRS